MNNSKFNNEEVETFRKLCRKILNVQYPIINKYFNLDNDVELLKRCQTKFDNTIKSVDNKITNNKKTRSKYIYFIQSKTGEIKIGVSENPMFRLNRLNYMSPVELSMLYYESGGYEKELYFHKRFSDLRIGKSEWFKPGKDILTYINIRKGNVKEVLEKRAEEVKRIYPKLVD